MGHGFRGKWKTGLCRARAMTENAMLHTRKQPRRGLKLRSFAASGLVGLLAVASVQAGTLYRWTDERGNPVISDRPPAVGTPYITLDGARYGVKSSSAARTPKPMPTQQAESVKAGADRSGDGTEQAMKTEQDPKLCDQAKDNVFKLETFPRIRITDDDGSVRFMTDEERKDKLASARKDEAAACKD